MLLGKQFLGKQLSNSQRHSVQSITLAQARGVIGGCSNPHGCTSLNAGVAVVTLRQPGVTDFEDGQMGWRLPTVWQ